MDDLGKIHEEVMNERAPDLVARAHSRSRNLENWGWKNVRRHYRYGPKGTGQARAIITAERGAHRVTCEYLFSLQHRHKPLVRFLGGFWDGGSFKDEKSFRELAKPLSYTYTPTRKSTKKGIDMATETATRKRVAKRAAAPAATNGKAPAKAPAKRAAKRPAKAPTVDEALEADTGPTKKEIAAQERAERREEKAARDAELTEQILNLRSEGAKWDEVAESLEISVGLAQFLGFIAEYDDEYPNGRPEATPSAIKADRDAGLSWGRVQAKYHPLSRKTAWDLLKEAGVDHFDSDIGKGGRYVNRDEDARAERAAAKGGAKPTPKRRGRKPTFKGFTNETAEEDIHAMISGRRVEWTKTRGDGTDTAHVKEGTVEITMDKRDNTVIKFSDGAKTRTIYAKNVVAVS